ncbi:MAG: tail fiber domain-containing protein [Bacteroidota bacterium]
MKKNPITNTNPIRFFTLMLLSLVFCFSLSAQDDDWYEAPSLPTPPTNINQSIYTFGNVGIGFGNPTSDLQVFGLDVWFEGNDFRSGHGNVVSTSVVSGGLGADNQIYNSHSSYLLGNANLMDANTGSVGLGGQNFIEGSEWSVALGEENQIFGGHGSVSLGGHNQQGGPYTITIGEGQNNFIPQSMMVGFGGNLTLFADASNVGVGLSNPQERLHVDGVIRANSLVGGGNVCADANGNLILSGACGGGGVGDDLGNHTATQPLDMSCFDIVHVGNMEFCNGIFFDQTNPNEMVVNGGAVGIGVLPSSVGTSPLGNPAMLAVAGSIWANGFWYSSDKRFKKNINKLSSAIETVKAMNGYRYEYKRDEFSKFNFDEGQTIGFLAQELKEAAPELVKKGANGYYQVNYLGVIPVLTEAIKEQQEIIEAQTVQMEQQATETEQLRNEIAELRTAVQSICNNGCGNLGSTSSDNSSSSTPAYWDEVRLDQNAPNPFNSVTTIRYYLPEAVQTASLVVYDLQGKQLKKFDIAGHGNGTVTIDANELQSGMYLYSLMIDGKASSTLKMILTD